MHAWTALVVVVLLATLGYAGGRIETLRFLFGAAVPLAAIVVFLAGIAFRVLRWAAAPVPFRIPTTCGQQKSLPWIRHARLDNPASAAGVLGRMALEVLLFRSLFRNTRAELHPGPRLVYGEEKWLWLAAMVFHWSFLIVFLRHLRFFLEPVPGFVLALQAADGFFQIGAPVLYWSGVTILAALVYLLVRRLRDPQVRYVSLFTDYFALYLLLGLVISGLLMRYFTKVDIIAIKQLAVGLVTGTPVVPRQIAPLFFVHLFLLSVLLAYFPFSKLAHMPGIFLSPTRNLANNNRARRHVNPWNYPVKVHTYEEWEEEFRDKLIAAGLPLDKE
jgi:nitrate reductase gamma subunit